MPKIDRQREHQANERTFLAWLRTSIALISFGFAIARFSLFLRQLEASITPQESAAKPFHSELGVSLVIFGIVVILLAAWRYNQVFGQIERGNYRPYRLMVWITTSVVVVLGVLSMPLALWHQVPNPPDVSPDPRPSQRLNLP